MKNGRKPIVVFSYLLVLTMIVAHGPGPAHGGIDAAADVEVATLAPVAPSVIVACVKRAHVLCLGEFSLRLSRFSSGS